jgi:hypothetical protein
VAEPAPGWLIPGDLSRSAVRERALGLLGGFLSDEQRHEVERFHGYRVEHPGRTFWIPLDGPPRCALLDEGVIEHVCIAPKKGQGMPDADIALTYHLWISTDPEGFMSEANVMKTESFDDRLTSDELLRLLAGPLPAPRARRRRRRPKRASARIPYRDPDELRALFDRHGKVVEEDVLSKLSGL